jgi:hypothetical protein
MIFSIQKRFIAMMATKAPSSGSHFLKTARPEIPIDRLDWICLASIFTYRASFETPFEGGQEIFNHHQRFN